MYTCVDARKLEAEEQESSQETKHLPTRDVLKPTQHDSTTVKAHGRSRHATPQIESVGTKNEKYAVCPSVYPFSIQFNFIHSFLCVLLFCVAFAIDKTFTVHTYIPKPRKEQFDKNNRASNDKQNEKSRVSRTNRP
jgi:hypothetical protein